MEPVDTPLPKAPILGYLSNVSTPTRVRVITARCVFWIGIVVFAGAAVLLAIIGAGFYEEASAWNNPPTFQDFQYALRQNPEFLILFCGDILFLLGPAIPLPILAAPIRHGRKSPAILGVICLAPLIFLLTVGTALFFSFMLVVGTGIAGKPEHIYLLWLLPAPIPILLILLLSDLARLMIWIVRNPLMEKPPTAFLPGHRPEAPQG